MKTLSILLALATLFLGELALAASAVVTSVTGTAQAQSGTASPRPLRQGDEVLQGDVVSTGGNSSLVLKFDDGQVTALTSNSRMQITNYQYEPQARTGNIVLSLLQGGMRAVSGLLGRAHPDRVSYRAGAATIGIRGTDVTIALGDGLVVVTVSEGAISFTYGGQTVTVPTGQGAVGADGRITPGTVAAVFSRMPPGVQQLVGGLEGLTNAINNAVPGTPRSGGEQGAPAGATGPTPGGTNAGGASGGGNASVR